MKHRLLIPLILLSAPFCCAAWNGSQRDASSSPQSSHDKIYDARSFGAELHRIDALLQSKPSATRIAELRKALPQSWNVATPERTYSISTEPLRSQLDAPSIGKAEAWIELLQVEIKASESSVTSSTAAKQELEHILRGAEFAGVRPPGPIELMRARVAAWLGKMFERLFRAMGQHPIGAQILYWLLLVGGVAFVALWIFRYFSNRDSMTAFKPATHIITARTWQEWLRSARQAASRGDFREAVHSAYWAGIARLEDIGAVPHDRTKTPREYLRIVAPSNSEHANVRTDVKEPLTALTSRMERAWYANRGASSEDFRESLRQLEALGCPLD